MTFDEWAAYVWSRIDIRGPDECWPFIGYVWTGRTYKGSGGYAILSRTKVVDHAGNPIKVPYGAHRAAWFTLRGPIPDGFTIDHECHNRDLACPGGPSCLHRRCCNPAHLSAIPNQLNAGRRKPLSSA